MFWNYEWLNIYEVNWTKTEDEVDEMKQDVNSFDSIMQNKN